MSRWRAAVPIVLLVLGAASLAVAAISAQESIRKHGGLLPWPGKCPNTFRIRGGSLSFASATPSGCMELTDASAFGAMGAALLALAIALGRERTRLRLVALGRRAFGVNPPAPRNPLGGVAGAAILMVPSMLVQWLSENVPPWCYVSHALQGVAVAALLGGIGAVIMTWRTSAPSTPRN